MFGYDHGNYLALGSNQRVRTRFGEFFPQRRRAPVPEILAGLETGYGLVHYSRSGTASSITAPDATQWNVGAFCTATISDYMDARLDAVTPCSRRTQLHQLFQRRGIGFYLQFLITHRVNRFFNYSLSAGRSIDLQYSGSPTTVTPCGGSPIGIF